MDWDKASIELAAPLDPKHVKPPKQYGPKGDYIEAWHAQSEANRIFGFGGWSQEVTETTCVSQADRKIGQAKKDGFGVTYTAKVRIVIDGVSREDFGAGHGYDVDLGLAHESAIKEAVSDAMKRAMKSLGNPFGLALYDKTKANVRTPEPTLEDRCQKLHDGLVGKIKGKGAEAAFKVLGSNGQGMAFLKENAPDLYAKVNEAAKGEGVEIRDTSEHEEAA